MTNIYAHDPDRNRSAPIYHSKPTRHPASFLAVLTSESLRYSFKIEFADFYLCFHVDLARSMLNIRMSGRGDLTQAEFGLNEKN
ncbi:hypothetical protein GCM10010136_01530 [Limoniibacter endophyticus]|uniref:Uncharacterized protein n=1 Tax=Limoniibacter endophyticus TaxID=1565040 RepID=A0A8J3GEL5_9HYPH|nr:hypothetical protein GCM10010136_01530 [Limoniibacter endophyticus]